MEKDSSDELNQNENSPPTVDSSQFICGGYLLVRTAHPPDWITSRPLLPANPVSICSCIYPRFPDAGAITWCTHSPEDEANNADWYESIGIPEQSRASATEWATRTFDEEHGCWGIFYDVTDARKAYRKFLGKVTGVRLLAIGLHQSLVADYLEQTFPEETGPEYSPTATCGQWNALSDGQPFSHGGKLLGYELLVTQYGLLTCSWLCNGSEEDLLSETQIRPNSHSLISDYNVASSHAATATARGDEPGLWMPWAIVEYELSPGNWMERICAKFTSR